MTNSNILSWIKRNLSSVILQAISDAKIVNPDLIYTESWIAGMVCRETGELIGRFIPTGSSLNIISSLTRGDYSQRPGETEKQFHGYGFIQVDIASYPDWIKTGAWKDPYKNISFAISILEEKRKYLAAHFPNLPAANLGRYITAAFNCGQGNEAKVIEVGKDPDAYTAGHNYSEQVFEFASIYEQLP